MIARAALAFLALPGVVAFLVPWLLLDRRLEGRPLRLLGALPLVLGGALLFWCVAMFYRDGGGTLAPWDPPRALVVAGPYRVSRNPMYVGVVLILWGWALGFRSAPLALYAAVMMVAFHVRVVLAEEPWLSSRYGGQWDEYKARVPRWLGMPR